MNSVAALKTALVAALAADVSVAALVGANIFDIRPRDTTVARWVYVGPINAQRIETDCGLQFQVRVRLYAADTTAGALSRDAAWSIADAMVAALHGQTLTLNAATMDLPLRFEQVGDVVDPAQPLMVFTDFTTIVHDGA